MYEEELPITGATVTVAGLAFNTWWIAVAGVTLVLGGMMVARIAKSIRAKAHK